MSLRGTFLVMAVLLAACVVPATAQQRLGDLVAQGGYDWLIGRWVATNDEGEKFEFRYEWALDKHVVLSDITMSGFKYHGMVMVSPTRDEAFDVGADNKGGLWKGTWYEDYAGLVHKIEHTSAQGEVHKGDVVHSRVDADTITVAIYAVDESGYRSAEPWAKLTYKRQPSTAVGVSPSAGQDSRPTDYQTLGDLVSQGGYEWLVGKWVATDNERKYEVEHKPILDMHAALMDVKIGDFKYLGMIVYAPARQEIVQVGADNFGGVWKGIWSEDYEGASHRMEYTKADGSTEKLEHVYVKTDNDTFRIKQYSVEPGGWRASQPRSELTFKRQKP